MPKAGLFSLLVWLALSGRLCADQSSALLASTRESNASTVVRVKYRPDQSTNACGQAQRPDRTHDAEGGEN